MKKTKIICSIGPASCDVDVMKDLVNAGMDVARINFSHATLEEKEDVIRKVEEVTEITGKNIGLLYDTKGPEFRCGEMMNGSINLVDGKEIDIVKGEVIGTEERFSVNHPNVIDDLKEGNIILLENGLMKLVVIKCYSDKVTCEVVNGGVLGSKKSINVPGVKLSVPFISSLDREDIIYACRNRGDFLALSFVSSKEDVLEVKEILKRENREDMQIISKIESSRGIDNLEEIIKESDGIMIARGDLGVEIPLEELPIVQKMIVRKCREFGKICIVATEMLASMSTSLRPTRAEVSDVANAVFDGTDAVMLSGETTIGKHPVEAVSYMAQICSNAEEHYRYTPVNQDDEVDITDAIARGVVDLTKFIDVKVIVAATMSGYTARRVSNLTPERPILAICTTRDVARKLSLCYGVETCLVPTFDRTENLIYHTKDRVREKYGMKDHEKFVLTGGFPLGEAHTTNLLRVIEM